MRRQLILLFALIGLAACQTAPRATCDRGDIQLASSLTGARPSPCKRVSANGFQLEIIPEAEPINPSPWYAFQLTGPVGARAEVTLLYATAQHRYAPWVREGNSPWRRLPIEQVRVDASQTRATLILPLSAEPLEVAAQPVYGLDRYRSLEARWQGEWRTIGHSVLDRPIRALVLPTLAGPDDDAPDHWILLLGRQHPPEIPGAWAFEAFADTMVARHRAGGLNAGLILVPLLNPDGVEAGHWRLNANLVDLNRNWDVRSEPETGSVAGLLADLEIGAGRLALMVDFHATVGDRLYLPQSEELSASASDRLDRWLAAMDANGLFEILEPRRTTPARRISAKSAFTDDWGAVALTWEAGDTTDEETVRSLATEAARLWE